MVLLKLSELENVTNALIYLHSTMVLLKWMINLKMQLREMYLHSTMVLLKLLEDIKSGVNKIDLHSTMVLLK